MPAFQNSGCYRKSGFFLLWRCMKLGEQCLPAILFGHPVKIVRFLGVKRLVVLWSLPLTYFDIDDTPRLNQMKEHTTQHSPASWCRLRSPVRAAIMLKSALCTNLLPAWMWRLRDRRHIHAVSSLTKSWGDYHTLSRFSITKSSKEKVYI